ncbi:polysaccharide deacetylase family protein [Candidatus Saccharibacteria bacterium]|nr:polysaccharide deacetylase family protein [Candidatus Saccharibacteria bacterium]
MKNEALKKIALSFDVEEFDLPREHGLEISLEDGVKISSEGLERIMKVLEKEKVKATFFVTGNFAEKNPEAVKEMVRGGHEVGCHGVDHFSPKPSDLEKSKKIIERITRKKVFGYRVPRMQKIDYEKLKELGYKYDSSVNPTWIPGRYNNRKVPRKVYKTRGVFEIPTSVAGKARIPLFWLALHLFPARTYIFLCKKCLRETGYLAIYFHPWEFSDLNYAGVPGYIRKNSGEKLARRLERTIEALREDGAKFVGYNELIEE